ncbi:MAG: PEGA domain-containing protein [Armatimonadota bacterium]|nr:PEGA domain-containing protein [Armatimonadota bacterium]MDR7532011.1 PEGA domain-containing protein [Armatimonadota bacterium]MDR7535942.1 PEGA domain-containing protein [Armatimonadota bacterium]
MESEATVVTCPRCGTANPADLKFCYECWALLRGRPCPHCGRPATRVGALTCESCGRSLDAFGPRAAAGEPVAAGPAGEDVGVAAAAPEPTRDAALAEAMPPAPDAARIAARTEPLRLARVDPRQLEREPEGTGIVAPAAEAAGRRRPAWAADAAVAGLVIVIVVVLFLARGALRRGPVDQGATPAPSAPAAAPAPAASVVTPRAPGPAAIVSIHTIPAGARVDLDGRPVGTSTLTLDSVTPGVHTLRVSKAGFRPATREIRVGVGERVVVRVALAPATPPRRRPSPPPPPPPPQQ